MMKRLSYAALAALAIESPCTAFTVSSPSCASRCRQATSLASVTNDGDNLNMSRRSFANVIAASSFATVLSSPFAAFAADEDAAKSPSSKRQPLENYIYNILRVREATEQETRIINSKTFKDSQRANVKLAVKFILNNYKLSDSVIAASSYLSGTAKFQASSAGQSAVQSKEAIVTKGLESVRRDIDEFLSYFPRDVLDQQKAKVMEENELNYKEFDPELGSILNPNPK
eukprot:scaffold386_cov135-Skeletonema_menzelii.AAC.11